MLSLYSIPLDRSYRTLIDQLLHGVNLRTDIQMSVAWAKHNIYWIVEGRGAKQ